MKKIFSFDAETDGLWGNPFAIAATVTSPDGIEVATFAARLDDSVVTNDWVKENVLPHIQDIQIVDNYETMLNEFADFYMEHKADAVCICHNPVPVEAHLLREMHRVGAIGEWDAPYPLIDLNGLLDHAGEDPTLNKSCGRDYIFVNGLPMPLGVDDDPRFDCRAVTIIYRHLKGW